MDRADHGRPRRADHASPCNLARVRARRGDALLVLVVALAARLSVVLWARDRFPAVEDGHYYDVLARRIAEGVGYTWLWPDGAITYAAHYPVGYPALLAGAYLLFGASVPVAMTLHALLGAASAYCAHRLLDGDTVARWRPLAAGLSVALHPALVPYTAAVMTEGVTASVLVVAAALAARARRRGDSWRWVAGLGIVLGVATLVRPQCLVLAPVFGALAVPTDAAMRSRLARSAFASAIALACVLPWTARNCARMHRCALVSVNGGWNLLIGVATETGGWQPVAVPADCATVWDEAEKDVCFERAAWRGIARSPGAWAARAPAKLAVTFDYFGAAPWYLHASNPRVFGDRAKVILAEAETTACSLWLLAALGVCGWMDGDRPAARKVVALLAAVAAAVTLHAWLAYAAIPAVVALSGWRAIARGPALVPIAAAVIAATACLHAVFFGAGRYGLVAAPFVAMLAFVEGRRAPAKAASFAHPPGSAT